MGESNRGGWLVAVLIALLTASSTPFWVRPLGERLGLVTPTPAQTPDHASAPDHTSAPDHGSAAGTDGTPTAPPAPRMSAMMLNTNLDQHDLSSAGMERASAAVCAADCLANDQCYGMTFVAHPDAPGGMCWQKADGAPTTSRAGMTSSYKIK